jgi:CRISPR/Cas system-associated exonuclease Cas4 (RecB family)
MRLLEQVHEACRTRHYFPRTKQACLSSIDQAAKDIEAAAAGIRAGRFPPDPAYQACLYCPYRSICPRGNEE